MEAAEVGFLFAMGQIVNVEAAGPWVRTKIISGLVRADLKDYLLPIRSDPSWCWARQDTSYRHLLEF